MCTLVHRADIGDIIWLSWNGRSARGGRAKPAFGAQLIAVTVTGARALSAAGHAGEMTKGHRDIVLRNWLASPHGQHRVDSSYLYPAVGSFKGRWCRCDPELALLRKRQGGIHVR